MKRTNAAVAAAAWGAWAAVTVGLALVWGPDGRAHTVALSMLGVIVTALVTLLMIAGAAGGVGTTNPED